MCDHGIRISVVTVEVRCAGDPTPEQVLLAHEAAREVLLQQKFSSLAREAERMGCTILTRQCRDVVAESEQAMHRAIDKIRSSSTSPASLRDGGHQLDGVAPALEDEVPREISFTNIAAKFREFRRGLLRHGRQDGR